MAILTGYVRVSGDSQEDNNSLPIQRQAITDYCNENCHQLFGIFEDVCSGAEFETRQGFQFALQTVFTNLSDGLLVYRLDRFSRKALDAEYLRKEFKEKGKQLLSTCDQIDIQSYEGQFFYQVKSAFAEYERKQIKARCQSGRARKRDGYGYYTGGPPFGWMAKNGTLEEEPGEQQVISLIYSLRKDGLTQRAIAKHLNDLGHKTKKGRDWKQAQVYSVLQGIPGVVLRVEAGKRQRDRGERLWLS